MRIAFAVLLAAAAFADESVPDPVAVREVPATGPLSYRLAFASRREHSCSQSFESEGRDGTLVLTVAADGAARVVLDGEETYVFGPSLGRFRAGARDFQRSAHPLRAEWTGTAVRGPGTLDLSLLRTDGPRRPLRVACRVGRIPLAAEADGGKPADGAALLCSPAEALDEVPLADVAADHALPLGRGPGYRADRDRLEWSDLVTYRRAR